ncbi:unnamed protein product [Clonostachys rosea]|uniref:F-box domain-containing protein n=1 Tax=Bionectria ochroleuca TaxID=29856 RepID=A0ABY6U229_BIOOC|nr:unnamed protein product [Clonostachys rosea]
MPPEVHLQILSGLVTNDSNDIFSVLCTCKKLYEIALPLSVKIFQEHTPYVPGNDDIPMRIRVLKFLRYITITKPGLASYVKTLVLGRWLLVRRFQQPIADPKGPTREEMDIYSEIISRVVARHSDPANERNNISMWIADLKDGMVDAIFALLLVVCSGLKEVCFPAPRESYDYLQVGFSKRSHLGFILRLATETDSPDEAPLSRLQHVYHEGLEGEGYENWTDHALPFFRLPNLRTYECLYGKVLEEDAVSPTLLAPSSSTIQDLVFRSSCIPANFLKTILACSKTLRSFEYMRGLSDRGYPYTAAMPRDVMEAIQDHAGELEHLTLDLDDDFCRETWLGNSDRIFMGDIVQQMTKLKTLVVGMLPLTGIINTGFDMTQFDVNEHLGTHDKIEGTRRLAECLPESLERLEIICCGKGILEEAQELLDLISMGRRFRDLSFVRFVFNIGFLDLSGVHLTCSSSSLRLETVLQARRYREFDLAKSCRLHPSPCSRLHPRTSNYYDDWHKYRFSGKLTVRELFNSK